MFFDSSYSLWRIVLVGTLTYLALIAVLLITGKRTLSKLNAFDFIITVALGSTVATVLLSEDVSLAEGVTALLLLTALQFGITWASVRLPQLRTIVTHQPTLLFHQGTFLTKNMNSVRITKSEIMQAIRAQGIGALGSVGAVVLETNGKLTVIQSLGGGEDSVLEGVKR